MIKFVYFDVGGVALQDFTGRNYIEEISTKIKLGKFGSLYHLWNVLHKKFRTMFPQIYEKYILGRVKKLAQNKSIWSVIDKFGKTSKIGLLTNMYPDLLDAIKKAGLLPNNNWNAVVDSSVEGFEKPEMRIYEIAEKKSGFKGKEILFIDNTKQNIDAAIKFGWNGFLYNPNNCQISSKRLFEYYKKIYED